MNVPPPITNPTLDRNALKEELKKTLMEKPAEKKTNPLKLPEIFNFLENNKNWTPHGNDITDYFNYGFTQDTFKYFAQKVKNLFKKLEKNPTQFLKSNGESSNVYETQVPISHGGLEVIDEDDLKKYFDDPSIINFPISEYLQSINGEHPEISTDIRKNIEKVNSSVENVYGLKRGNPPPVHHLPTPQQPIGYQHPVSFSLSNNSKFPPTNMRYPPMPGGYMPHHPPPMMNPGQMPPYMGHMGHMNPMQMHPMSQMPMNMMYPPNPGYKPTPLIGQEPIKEKKQKKDSSESKEESKERTEDKRHSHKRSSSRNSEKKKKKSRSKEKSRKSHKSKDRERKHDKSRSRDKDRDREHKKDKDRDRDRDHRDKDRDRDRDRKKDKSKDRSREKSRDKHDRKKDREDRESKKDKRRSSSKDRDDKKSKRKHEDESEKSSKGSWHTRLINDTIEAQDSKDRKKEKERSKDKYK